MSIALAALATNAMAQSPPAGSSDHVETSPSPPPDCSDAHMDIRNVSITCFVDGSWRGRPGAIYNAPFYGAPTSPEPIPMQAYSEPAEASGYPVPDYSGSTSPGTARIRPYSYSPGIYRPRTVYVHGYTRRDGTRVRAHTRSAPRRR